jgi:hypothetical protein
MEIIASTTNGVLISATESEVKEILGAVNGERPKELKIGQKIPAIDYASTITKVKSLSQNSYFTYMLSKVEDFTFVIEQLKIAVESAKNIEI